MENHSVRQIFHLIKNVDIRMTQLFEREMEVSLTRYQILNVLMEYGKQTQRALQAKLRIDNAAITRHLKLLEESEYVERVRNPENQREIIVSLTETGKEIVSSCVRLGENFIGQLFAGFTASDIEKLRYALMKMDQNMMEMES